MRVWLDPQKVAQRGMTATDVVNAIREQNVQVAAGVIGASPTLPNVPVQLNVNAQGRLQNEAEFERHRAQDLARWRGHASARRGARRTRGIGIRPAFAARQQVGGRDRDQPAAGRELAADLRRRSARR